MKDVLTAVTEVLVMLNDIQVHSGVMSVIKEHRSGTGCY